MASANGGTVIPVLDEKPGDGDGVGQEDATIIDGRGEFVTGDKTGLDDLLTVRTGSVLAGDQTDTTAEHEGVWEGLGLGSEVFDADHVQPGLLPNLPDHGCLNGLTGLDRASHDRVAPESLGGTTHEEKAVGSVDDRHDDG